MTSKNIQNLATIAIAFVFFAVPANSVFSQSTTTTTATNAPVGIQSSNLQSVASATQAALESGNEKLEHGSLSIDLGIRRRSSRSASVLAETEITAREAINDDFFQSFARHIMLTEPVQSLDIGDEEITAEIEGEAKLFGIIPASTPYRIQITFDDQLQDVSVEHTGRLSWLYTKKSSEQVVADIAAYMDGVQYLSTTQLRAFLIEAIVETL